MSAIWQPVMARLDRFAAAGRPVRLWLRDDDAVEATAALDRLIGLCEAHAVPLLLAVIPALASTTLAARLAATTGVTPCQHGYRHANHAPASAKKREFGPDRPLPAMLAEIAAGHVRLQSLFPEVAPVFVPPWNRIDPQVAASLPRLGFAALSTFGPPAMSSGGGCRRLDSTLDIIDWHGTRGGRPVGALVAALCDQLDAAEASGAPIGLLTHHLVHDAAAWAFLAALFERTAGHAGLRWSSAIELIGLDASS